METIVERSETIITGPSDVTDCIETCMLLEDYTSAVRQRALARCGIRGVCDGETQGVLRPRICSQDVRTRIDLQLAADSIVQAGK